MMARIEYAKTADDAHVAYSVVGDGPIDLIYTGGYTISIDSYDDEPHFSHMWRRFASFCRLIRFDMRGIGLSDPIDADDPPTIFSHLTALTNVQLATLRRRVFDCPLISRDQQIDAFFRAAWGELKTDTGRCSSDNC